MTCSIAFVGAGPTTLYALHALLNRAGAGLSITVFEAEDEAGPGAPYRPDWNDPAMLSNIASIEIPPLTETLVAWVQRQPATALEELGLTAEALDERSFVPRLALGRYFRDQFDALVEHGRRDGVEILVHTSSRVIDVAHRVEGPVVSVVGPTRATRHYQFDRVVLATGHQWPTQQQVRPGYFQSPWPTAGLASVPPVAVGIRGASLTAIDTAIALASAHGVFEPGRDGLIYRPSEEAEGFRMTMMSRKGLLPEADFYFPLPHAPLKVCTPDAIRGLIETAQSDLLDRSFDLFRRELMAVDPTYGRLTGLEGAPLEAFCDAYFAQRLSSDPFDWARSNLEEARRNHAARVTVAWRDAILRMHEVVAAVAPHLTGPDFERFNRFLKPVFVDNYGAVPHASIERLLALHSAGKLEVLAVGDDYRLDPAPPEGGARLRLAGRERHFPIFIEATGQRPLSALQFPFLSLLEQGVIRDVDGSGDAQRGILVDDEFHPVVEGRSFDSLFCVSLPFLMGRHPFIQGITSSHDMGEMVGKALARMAGVQETAEPDGTESVTAEAA